MKYVEEKDLLKQFWKMYGYRSNIIAYEFECQARHGGVDLLTAERVDRGNGNEIQFVSFEFKLGDIKKAIAQAEKDIDFSHKTFIVVPDTKEKVIKDRYLDYIRKLKYLGVITVEYNGRWNMVQKAYTKHDDQVKLNQTNLKLLTKAKHPVL